MRLFSLCGILFLFQPSTLYSQQPLKGIDTPNKQEQVSRPANETSGTETIPKIAQESKAIKSTTTEVPHSVSDCYAECAEYKQDKDWWHEFRTDPIAAFTGLLFIATALLWWSTRSLVKDAKDTSKRELRAYIGRGGGEVFVLPNHILRGVVEIRNFGETPAHNVMVSIAGELRAPEDKRPFNDPDFIPHKQPIAPTMSWTFGYEFLGMTDQDLKDVLADKKLVYIWGQVKYQDIYNETHTLRFRLRNVVKLFVTTEEGTSIKKWKFYPEDEGNEAT